MARSGKPAKDAKGGKPPRSEYARRVKRVAVLLVLLVASVAGVYRIGGPDTRAWMERRAIAALTPFREFEAMPRPLGAILDSAHDSIPSSAGFSIDGASLDAGDGHFLGGIPESGRPVLLLRNEHYTNLFDETGKQSRCLAFTISEKPPRSSSTPVPAPDPRVPKLRPADLSMGPWTAGTLLPRHLLAPESSGIGSPDASAPVTAFFPVEAEFLEDRWARLLQTVIREYPARFDKLWILTGPIIRQDSSKLSTGVYVPDGFYLVVLDLLPDGRLRALSFVVPVESESRSLTDYLSSLAIIEKYTDLRFLPDLEAEARETLSRWVAPKPW